jgi:hypothetical protein
LTKLCFDYDPLLYMAGSIGEKRSVKVVHRESGDEYEFSTRTDFYGHWKKKEGGWLAEYNTGRTSPRLASEFDYTDIQEPEPIEFCMKTLKEMIERVKEYVGASWYYGYSGKGKSFREDVSTVMMYKGNRLNAIRPVHLDDLKHYLVRMHNCKIVTGIEADDAVSMDAHSAYRKWEKSGSTEDLLVTAAVDKDYFQCAAHLLHPNELGTIDSDSGGFGWLKENADGDVKGRGRMWLYWQIISGDDADNYCAHAAYDKRAKGLGAKRWGVKTAFPYLMDAKNDKEAWEALLRAYKHLYPTSVTLPGWRAYEDPDKMTTLKPDWEKHVVTIDAMAMLQENATLAFMLRHKEDKINVSEILTKLGVEYAE